MSPFPWVLRYLLLGLLVTLPFAGFGLGLQYAREHGAEAAPHAPGAPGDAMLAARCTGSGGVFTPCPSCTDLADRVTPDWCSCPQHTQFSTTTDTCVPVAAAVQYPCMASSEYVVFVRSRGDTVGSDFIVRALNGAPAPSGPVCTYVPASGDTTLTQFTAAYEKLVSGRLLVLDVGTAPYPRTLEIYDLAAERTVYTDKYSGPATFATTSVEYWQPIDTTPTPTNCPELATYKAEGFGAGIEERVTLELSTLTVTRSGSLRCAARQ